MAELLSVQVHAPVTLTSVNATSPTGGTAAASSAVEMEHLKADCSGARRLKKVDNATQDVAVTGTSSSRQAAGATFDYLPKRHTVNIEFDQLTYSVSEGRKKGYDTRSLYLYHSKLYSKWFV